jgi:hypothetical protein
MVPVFLHIMSNGDIWASNDIAFTPTGTILGTYRIASGIKSQKIGTLTAVSGAVTATSGATGKRGKEIV